MSPFFRRHATLALALAALCLSGLGTDNATAALTRVSPYLTRAEAAAIVMLASPAPLPRDAKNPYVDVLPNDWFAPMVIGAAKIGALSPDESGTRIRPFKPVNRATFLKMVSLSFGLPVHQAHSYADVAKDAWYAPYAGVDATYGLFRHADASLLEPDKLVTQDEAKWAMDAFLRARSKAEEKNAKGAAIAQASGKVQLYTVISTKRLRVVLVGPDARAAAPKQSPVPNPSTMDVRAEVLELVNAERAKLGLAALVRNAALEGSAQAYADQMDHDGFFGHVDPNGKTLKDRIDAVGFYSRDFSADCQCIKGYALAENLARGQRTAEEAVRAWMDSPSHRDAILGSDFTDIGVGVRSGVWVQHFGGLLTPGGE
jgi:uncharacterized protein YkwD